MSLFYDPKTRKVKMWIIAAFVIVPILLVAIIWVFGQQKVGHKAQDQTKEADIFQ